MPFASFSDPRFVSIYDPLNRSDAAEKFYVTLAGDQPCTVLDAVCGTGKLAVELAKHGHRVTAADPTPAMLDIAQEQLGAELVEWVVGSGAELALRTRFDLIIISGYAFQLLLDDRDVMATLGNLRRHLVTHGRLAFETRNPAAQAWRSWTPEKTRSHLNVSGIGPVDVHFDIRSVEEPMVTLETHFKFGTTDELISASTLRFLPQDEVARLVVGTGFNEIEWNGSPLTAGSPEIIVITNR